MYYNGIGHALKNPVKMNITMASLRSKFDPVLTAQEMKKQEDRRVQV